MLTCETEFAQAHRTYLPNIETLDCSQDDLEQVSEYTGTFENLTEEDLAIFKLGLASRFNIDLINQFKDIDGFVFSFLERNIAYIGFLSMVGSPKDRKGYSNCLTLLESYIDSEDSTISDAALALLYFLPPSKTTFKFLKQLYCKRKEIVSRNSFKDKILDVIFSYYLNKASQILGVQVETQDAIYDYEDKIGLSKPFRCADIRIRNLILKNPQLNHCIDQMAKDITSSKQILKQAFRDYICKGRLGILPTHHIVWQSIDEKKSLPAFMKISKKGTVSLYKALEKTKIARDISPKQKNVYERDLLDNADLMTRLRYVLFNQNPKKYQEPKYEPDSITN